VGARFPGTNRNGRRWWTTTVTVTAATPARRFAFRTMLGPKPVAEWAYDIAPTDGGCELTESWTRAEGAVLRAVARLFTGVADRAAYTTEMIEATLAGVKRTAEAGHQDANAPATS
jgi:Polyketide cyclase / dehydrase and lipid transport